MSEIPFHPSIVHLPIGISFAAAIIGILTWMAIKKKWLDAKAWWLVTVLQGFVFVTGFAALKSGQQEEEQVKTIVVEEAIEAHESKAKLFLWVSGLAFASGVASPLVPAWQGVTQVASAVLSLGSLGTVLVTGKTGGALVYEHGAANRYVPKKLAPSEAGLEK